ncbi:DUF5753 domain-containing protein [Streptomyces sp. NPDC102381]|uniref:DUF5753 domain-containing protein n=1 Tax=Streptomyces sp. NPDC102381 TaxID=3366164 RepID=UPI0037F7B20B
MADQNNDFEELLEGSSLGSRGARELRARTPTFRARAVRSAAASGWWHRYADVLPNWYPTFMGLEYEASLIRSYETHFVHGLLQTEAYARAVIREGPGGRREEDIDRHVAVRLERQQILTAGNAPQVHAVLDESALRRRGESRVMSDQLHHLIEVSERENVRLQIMPLSAGGCPSGAGSFSILRLAEPEPADIVYLEQLTSALYLDSRSDVAQYEMAMAELQQNSLTPQQSRDLLRRLTRQF